MELLRTCMWKKKQPKGVKVSTVKPYRICMKMVGPQVTALLLLRNLSEKIEKPEVSAFVMMFFFSELNFWKICVKLRESDMFF